MKGGNGTRGTCAPGTMTMGEELKNTVLRVSKTIEGLDKTPEDFDALLGLDGFIDEIIDVVDKKEGFDHYTRIETISALGERISKAAGLSTNIELVPKQVKLGGNGPIMGNAMLSAGFVVDYMGILGYPDVDPVFADFASRCNEVFCIAAPGHTDALEFADGKVMLGKQQTLKEITWERILEQVGLDKLVDLFETVDLVALVNWTMTPYMNDIWEHLLSDVCPRVKDRPLMFFDLADPEKRTEKDIARAMDLIKEFSDEFYVTLGLNRKEATEVAEVLNPDLSGAPSDCSLEEITTALAGSLDIQCLVVHPTAEAAAVVDGQYYHVDGPYTSNPRLTTGAGDNFNAGFCLGRLLGLDPEASLVTGTATSGFYVRNMRSPGFEDLKQFLGLWAEHAGEEF